MAEALGKMGDRSGIQLLVAALEDKSVWVRFRAAEALGTLGDSRGVELLEELLDDEDQDVREVATEALEKLRGKPSGKP